MAVIKLGATEMAQAALDYAVIKKLVEAGKKTRVTLVLRDGKFSVELEQNES